MLFQQRRPCSTRKKSGTGIRYPTLTNDPRRSFKCMSPIDSSTHYPAFYTVGLHCQTSTLTHACLCREAVCTIFMMVFGMTRPGGELTTYRARGRHANHWANLTRSEVVHHDPNHKMTFLIFLAGGGGELDIAFNILRSLCNAACL